MENGVATSIQDISNKFSITSEGFSSIQTTIVGLDSAINGVKADPSAGKEAQPGLKEIMKYISWDGDDLTLGNTSQPFKCKISSSELAFYENLEKVAWISNKELYILTAIIAKSIGCGNFSFRIIVVSKIFFYTINLVTSFSNLSSLSSNCFIGLSNICFSFSYTIS